MTGSSGASKSSDLSLPDWVSFIRAYLSSLDSSYRLQVDLILGTLGALVVLNGVVFALGPWLFGLFALTSAIPMTVFFVLVLRGKRRTYFWFLEAILFTLGIVPLALGLLGLDIGEGAPPVAGWTFLSVYAITAALVVFLTLLYRGFIVLKLAGHGLDMLSQAIMFGLITDPRVVEERFKRITFPFTASQREWALAYARLRVIWGRLPLEGLDDETLHKWIVQTGGQVDIRTFLKEKSAARTQTPDSEE